MFYILMIASLVGIGLYFLMRLTAPWLTRSRSKFAFESAATAVMSVALIFGGVGLIGDGLTGHPSDSPARTYVIAGFASLYGLYHLAWCVQYRKVMRGLKR